MTDIFIEFQKIITFRTSEKIAVKNEFPFEDSQRNVP